MLETPVDLSLGSEVKLEVVVQACNPNTWAVEASQSLWVQGQPNLCREFQGSQIDIVKPYQKKNETSKQTSPKNNDDHSKHLRKVLFLLFTVN